MYFHPLILTEAQEKQRLAAAQDFARLWLGAIDRQYRWQMDAVADVFAIQKENLQTLAGAIDGTPLRIRCAVYAARAPFELFRVPMRGGEIGADILREVGVLVNRHAAELCEHVTERTADGASATRPLAQPEKAS